MDEILVWLAPHPLPSPPLPVLPLPFPQAYAGAYSRPSGHPDRRFGRLHLPSTGFSLFSMSASGTSQAARSFEGVLVGLQPRIFEIIGVTRSP